MIFYNTMKHAVCKPAFTASKRISAFHLKLQGLGSLNALKIKDENEIWTPVQASESQMWRYTDETKKTVYLKKQPAQSWMQEDSF